MCPRRLQQVGGFQTDLSNDVSRVDRLSRVNAQVDATYFGSLAGQHTLKAGVQFDRRSQRRGQGQQRQPRQPVLERARSAASGVATAIYRVFSNPIDPKRGSSHARRRSATRPSACSCRTRGPCPTA